MRQHDGTNHGGVCFKTRIVSLVLSIVMMLSMMPIGVFAASDGLTIQDGVLAGVTWYDYNCPTEITIPKGVTTIGQAAFSGRSSKLKKINLPSTLTTIEEMGFADCYALESLELPKSVKYIGNSAFYDCRALESINIPEGVTRLGEQAFYLCENLTTVELPKTLASFEGTYTFGYCGFSEIELPSNIQELPTGTFYYCDKLETIELPKELTTIGNNAFMLCDSLESVVIYHNVETIKEEAFDGCSALTDVYYTGSEEDWNAIEIASGNDELLNANTHFNHIYTVASGYCGDDDGRENLTWTLYSDWTLSICGTGEMYDYLWSNSVLPWGDYTSKIETVIIESGVTSIGDGVFSGFTNLSSIEIPDTVTRIGNYAFSSCGELTNIDIPSSVACIEGGAFYKCSGLTSIAIPSTVTDISYGIFQGCSNLSSISVSDFVTSIGDEAFYGCNSLINFDIPASVTKIGYRAFGQCTNLTSIAIPDGVTAIDGSTFSKCTNLTDVKLSSNLISIGTNAFLECNSLEDIIIPASVTTIDSDAFWADNLQHIYFEGNAPTLVDKYNDAFNSDATLYYIPGTTGWTDSEDYDAATGKWNGYTLCTWNTEEVVNTVAGNTYVQSTMIGYGPGVAPEDVLTEGVNPPSLAFTSESKGVFNVVNSEEVYKASFSYTIAGNIITIVPDTTGAYPEPSFSGKTTLYMEIQEDGSLKVYDYAPINGVSLGFTDKGDIFSLKTNEDVLPTVENFTLNGASDNVTIEVDEALTLGGIVKGNGNNLLAVSVALRSVDDRSVGGEWHTGKDADGNAINQNIESFDLTNFNDTVVIAGQPFGNMEALGPGDYTVQVYVTNQDGKGFEGEHTIRLTIKEKAVVSARPSVTGLKSSYTITEGEDLALNFTVKAGGTGGLLNVVTIREPSADEQYYRETNIGAESWAVNANISGLAVGVHTLYVYATATNFTGDPSNDIFEFTVTVNAKQSDEPQTLLERIKYAIVCNEHNTDFAYYVDDSGYKFDSVTIDDKDATAIGIYQWRGSRAFDIVKGIIENRELISEEEAKNILGTSLFNEVKYGNRKDWDGHMLSSAEAANVRKLLVTASGINQQRYQANQDAVMYRNNAEASGITQEAAKIVFADANNLAKGSATAIAASARVKVGGDGSKVTWELLLEAYENHSSLGGNEYKQRRVRLKRLLTEWYGSSSEEPPVIEPVVKPSPIEKMNCVFDNANPLSGETANLKITAKASENFVKFTVQWYNPKGDGISPKVVTKSVSGKEIDMTIPVDTNVYGQGKYHIYLVTEGGNCEFREVELYVSAPPSVEPPAGETNYKVYINGVETTGTYKNSSNQLLTISIDGISSDATYAGLQFISKDDSKQIKEFSATKDKHGFKFYVKTFEIPEGEYKVLLYSGNNSQKGLLDSATILNSVEITDYNKKWSGYNYTINYDFINDKEGPYHGNSSAEKKINDYVNKVINEHLQTDRVLRNLFFTNTYGYSRSAVFMIEGAGSDLSTSRRMAAMCVVIQNINGEPTVVYVNRNCTTIPDYVRNENGANGENTCPIIKDGVWTITTRNHSHVMSKEKRYAALNIGDANNALRFYASSYKNDTVTGVNIHARSSNDIAPFDGGWANSTGCFNIGKINNNQTEYDNFINIVTGVSGAKPYGSKFVTTPTICSQCGTINQDHDVIARMDMGVVIVNRELYETQLEKLYGSSSNADLILVR